MLRNVSRFSLPSEHELIARHFAPLSRGFAGAWNLLDDVAVMSPSAGHELVIKSDAVVEGVDFDDHTPADLIARKALRVNLSDLAAKGATPRAYLVDLIVPETTGETWIAAFASGLAHDQVEFSVHLIGGDMSSTTGPVTVAVTALGDVPMGRIVRRGGAHPGDLIYVTGTIGDAALGLSVLRGELPDLDMESAAYLAGRCRLPHPRVSIGPKLLGIATASIDVSDGLVADLRHICQVSRLSAVVDAGEVPLSPAARMVVRGEGEWLAAALTGGDDYEILFTAPPTASERIQAISQACRIPVTPVGRMASLMDGEPPAPVILGSDGEPLHFASEGWTHFGRRR